MVINDKRGKKKPLKSATKSRSTIVVPDKSALSNRIIKRTNNKNGGHRSSSSAELRKRGSFESNDRINGTKVKLYKNMKKLIEEKYKKVISKHDSSEKMYTERSQYDPKVYSLKPEIKDATFSEKSPIKTSCLSETSTAEEDTGDTRQDKRNVQITNPSNRTLDKEVQKKPTRLDSSKTTRIQKTKVKQKNKPPLEEKPIQKRKLDRRSPGLESSDSKKLQKTNETNENSSKITERTSRYRISKRLAALARHRELSQTVQKDMAYKPFKVAKRALLFRDRPCKLKPESNESKPQAVKKRVHKGLKKVFENNKQHFGKYRKNRRRLFNTLVYSLPTKRLLELAKPVVKIPPTDRLPPEEVFRVKQRALKAKCSKRTSELAFPVVRPEEFRIKVETPSSIRRRALRAHCTRRVRELAKPLPRRCRSAIRTKKAKEEE